MLKPRTLLQALLAGLAYAAGLYLVWLFLPLPGNWRPAAGLAPALGLLFGPAGAAAAALGNFLFDLRDEIDFGTFPGVLGNFFFAYCLPGRGHLRVLSGGPGFRALDPRLSLPRPARRRGLRHGDRLRAGASPAGGVRSARGGDHA